MATPLKSAHLRFTVFVTFNWVTLLLEPFQGKMCARSLSKSFGLNNIYASTHAVCSHQHCIDPGDTTKPHFMDMGIHYELYTLNVHVRIVFTSSNS